ncbi:unnamed protein product [Rotaria magnacalcarata]|uniref:BPL/LPL catalytic domain-containing protein n=1 Tax=Rotaria magnacalcarata TaxID=392030 RepID=A0A818ZRG6_9BILA|nr:unnamed protein product [Rotaria magnacalcarata]CAF1561149.1 unnamed protein product [Rotaria magnacalcarata]CAF2048496.1 unnamed protein product [Rotaria magnacalcarata]CAF2157543.1 unnamed protein product [Rotaria magnacalcarata]CAF2210853.1 unnamed protein product [Rotaria magnacalcarata]
MKSILRGGNRVLISKSTNVYTNLALERYLAENIKHQPKTRLLLLWRNQPCVVVGRYQNPFAESDIKYLSEKQIDLARRYSGGGTCYHDLGNLNVTIVTTREDYNRKKNLHWIVNTLNEAFNLTLHVTDRDDIFLDTFKVTGSASRLERLYAYHHFTLLINSYLNDLRRSLKSEDQMKITSKATSSVRSSVLNLADRNNSITYEKTIALLIEKFFQWNNEKTTTSCDYIDPLLYYEHIKDFENELKSQKFLYQVTPPFVYTIEHEKQPIEISVSNGIITDIKGNDSIIDKKNFLGQLFHGVYHNIQKLNKT